MSFSDLGLMERLASGAFQDEEVAVEFSCGGIVKKAIGNLEAVSQLAPGYIELAGGVTVIAACPNGDVEIEEVARVLIPCKNLCSVERAIDNGDDDNRRCECCIESSAGNVEYNNPDDPFNGTVLDFQIDICVAEDNIEPEQNGFELDCDCGALIADSVLEFRYQVRRIVDNQPVDRLELRYGAGLEDLKETITIECPDPFNPNPTPENPNTIIIRGQAGLFDENDQFVEVVNFVFYGIDATPPPGAGSDQIRMVIRDEDNNLIHDSGIVTLPRGNVNVGICP